MGDYLEEQKVLENLRITYNFIFGRKTPIQNISGSQKTIIQIQCKKSYDLLIGEKYSKEVNGEVAKKLLDFYQKNYFEPGIEAVDFIKRILLENKSNECDLQEKEVEGKVSNEPQKKENPLERVVKLKDEDDEGHIKKRGGISFL